MVITWERGNVGTWERENVGTWERENVGTWERGNVGTWERGNVGMYDSVLIGFRSVSLLVPTFPRSHVPTLLGCRDFDVAVFDGHGFSSIGPAHVGDGDEEGGGQAVQLGHFHAEDGGLAAEAHGADVELVDFLV